MEYQSKQSLLKKLTQKCFYTFNKTNLPLEDHLQLTVPHMKSGTMFHIPRHTQSMDPFLECNTWCKLHRSNLCTCIGWHRWGKPHKLALHWKLFRRIIVTTATRYCYNNTFLFLLVLLLAACLLLCCCLWLNLHITFWHLQRWVVFTTRGQLPLLAKRCGT